MFMKAMIAFTLYYRTLIFVYLNTSPYYYSTSHSKHYPKRLYLSIAQRSSFIFHLHTPTAYHDLISILFSNSINKNIMKNSENL